LYKTDKKTFEECATSCYQAQNRLKAEAGGKMANQSGRNDWHQVGTSAALGKKQE
jgi:hypothetical protein